MSTVTDWEWDSAPLEMLEMGYEVYLNRLFESLLDEDTTLVRDTESGLSFCGCDTCCTRETLSYLMPRILDLHAQGHIRKVESD